MELNKKTYLQKHLEQQPTPELEQLLQTELKSEEPEEELVRLLLHILEERDQQDADRISIEGGEPWEKYKAEGTAKRTSKKKQGWASLRVAAILVAVFTVVVLTLPQIAKANSWVELMARWSDSFFELFTPSSADDVKEEYIFQTDNPGLQQVYDAVVEMGITEPVVPMWIEDGYELKEIEVLRSPTKIKLYARLTNGNSTVAFVVNYYFEDPLYKTHKSDNEPGEYECGGITHYISGNNNTLTAVWTIDNAACSLSVDCQEETLNRMLDSIYVTEED